MITQRGSDPSQTLRRLASRSYNSVSLQDLRAPEPLLIRAGRAGGLPFDSLSTDVARGCLPAARVCFGHCFAATAAFESGQDFGKRVSNTFDPKVFEVDLTAMPVTQGYVRNGWNSDPSWNWSLAATIAEFIGQSQRLPVLLTKCFVPPSGEDVDRLVGAGTELRMTLSAFDSPAILESRLSVCDTFRIKGGIAVPVVVTSRFNESEVSAYQDQLVETLILRDFPAAENSLRFRAEDAVAKAIDTAYARPIAETDEMWCGRLYPYTLSIPTITSVADGYRGVPSGRMSELDIGDVAGMFYEPVPTASEVVSQPSLPKPKQAGVPHRQLAHR